MWALSTRAHLPLPLSKGNVILIGSFLDHLLAGTTHLEVFPARIDELPARIGCPGVSRIQWSVEI
jgi:hypothetical protein